MSGTEIAGAVGFGFWGSASPVQAFTIEAACQAIEKSPPAQWVPLKPKASGPVPIHERLCLCPPKVVRAYAHESLCLNGLPGTDCRHKLSWA